MDGKWLKTQFQLNPEKSKTALAQAVGLSNSTISKILAGTRQIKAAEYVRMRKFFGLPVDGDSVVNRGRVADKGLVVRSLSDSTSSNATDEESWVMPQSLLAGKAKDSPENIRIFTVSDSTMAPDFMVGEKILVDLSDTKPSPPGFFLITDGYSYIVRQCEVVPRSTPVKVRLSGHRGDSFQLPLSKAGITGRVIAKLTWLK